MAVLVVATLVVHLLMLMLHYMMSLSRLCVAIVVDVLVVVDAVVAAGDVADVCSCCSRRFCCC